MRSDSSQEDDVALGIPPFVHRPVMVGATIGLCMVLSNCMEVARRQSPHPSRGPLS